VQFMQTGSTLFLYVEGSNGELPDSPSFEQVNVRWSVSGNQVTLQDAFLTSKDFLQYSSLRLFGATAGEVVVTAEVKVKEKNKTFLKTLRVIVYDPLPNCSTILLPPLSEVDISNRDFGVPPSVFVTSKSDKVTVTQKSQLRVENVGDYPILLEQKPEIKEKVFFTVSVRKPKGLTILDIVDKQPKFCVRSRTTIKLGLYDDEARTFLSLKNWLQNGIVVKSEQDNVMKVRGLTVREGSKIAEVTLKGVSEGPALVAIHLEGVKSLYLTVNVLSADDCSLKMLRVEASLRKDSYFRTLCPSMSREFFKLKLASLLQISHTDILVLNLDTNDSVISFAIKGTEDSDLENRLNTVLARYGNELGLADAQQEWSFAHLVDEVKSFQDVCPILQKQEYSIPEQKTQENQKKPPPKPPTVFDVIKQWGLRICLFLIFIGCFSLLYRYWTHKWDNYRRQAIADLNASHGPATNFSHNAHGSLNNNRRPFYRSYFETSGDTHDFSMTYG